MSSVLLILQPLQILFQHTQSPRKFVLISSHGTHIVTKLRPVDHLRQLLIDNGGADGEVIKSYFMLYSETQACATCLILATSQSFKDAQVIIYSSILLPEFYAHISIRLSISLSYEEYWRDCVDHWWHLFCTPVIISFIMYVHTYLS